MEKKTILEFLSALEGYHSLLKTIHWSTDNKAEHLLVDDIDDDILDFEDRIAEASMGRMNIKFGVGELKTLMPNATTVENMLKELESDVVKLKQDIGDDVKYDGMHNILDEFLEKIYSWNYLRTLK